MRGVEFMGTSRSDLRSFPERARRNAGAALRYVQRGETPTTSKPLQGFGGAGVQEIIANDAAGTFRVVFTVTLPDAVYVLHAFQKRSTSGIKTSVRDLELIRSRLADARQRSADIMAKRAKEQ